MSEPAPNINSLKRYIKLFFSFAKANILLNLEYRANLISNFIADVTWYLGSIAVFETVYAYTQQVGGWTLAEIRVFMGITFLIDYFFMILITEGIEYLQQSVANGDLDLLLTKPVESQFILAFRKMAFAFMFSGPVALGYFIWAYRQWLQSTYGIDSLHSLSSYLPILWLFLLIPTALVTIYVCRFFIACTNVLFTKSESLQFLWIQVYRLGLKPDSIFSIKIRWIFLTLIPVSLAANIPAQVILNKYPDFSLALAAWAVLWSMTLLKLSNIFWKYCLKKYASASS